MRLIIPCLTLAGLELAAVSPAERNVASGVAQEPAAHRDRKAVASAGGGAQVTPVTVGLVALYEFDEGAGAAVADRSGGGEAVDLSVVNPGGVRWGPDGGLIIDGWGVAVRSAGPATKLIKALQATNEFTIEAILVPLDDAHGGPARIVSLSKDASVRNFTLAQAATQYVLRLRTSATDAQGMPEVRSEPGALKAERQHVVATYRAGEARLYVDGELCGEAQREGDFSTSGLWRTGRTC